MGLMASARRGPDLREERLRDSSERWKNGEKMEDGTRCWGDVEGRLERYEHMRAVAWRTM